MAGTLVYNEIVVIPYFGFDKNTKAAREKAQNGRKNKDVPSSDYVAVSPHAAYDAARNQRKVQMKVDRLEGGLNKSELTIEDNRSTVKSEYN